MKNLTQILFAVAVTICFSIMASAQKGNDKKPPKKEGDPPIIVVQPDKNKPKEDKPKSDKKPPSFRFYFKKE